ncbi:MAG: hypothetical protein HYV26_07845 [Candidatus Hydrogenedentes bacterium]|nr:hypothetical protein [Candidatus Hydrogenedentota bacterium]
MFSVDMEIKRRFIAECGAQSVFEVLADVPASAKHFPNLTALDALGENSYRWVLGTIGVRKFSLKSIFACKYKHDKARGLIQWTAIRGEGNAQVAGEWRIKALDEHRTEVKLKTPVHVEVPLPGLMRPLLAPLVVREYERLVDKYVANLCKTFEKEGQAKPARARASAKPKKKPQTRKSPKT